MTPLDALYEILRREGSPLHLKEIIRRVEEQKLIDTSRYKHPYNALNTKINIDIQKEESRFVKDKTKKATYGLRDYSHPPPPPSPEPEASHTGGRTGKRRKGPDFVGPGGELLVQSQLLFRNYEASKPVPDIGIDIVARKDGKTFYIQVKTRNMAEGPYSYDIKKQSFERTPKQGTYYVFVMRNPITGTTDFIVLPRAEMATMIKKGDIRQTARPSATSYQVLFTLKAGDVKCKGRSMVQYKNNWTIV